MAGRPLLERWRLHLRRGCDTGSASMASYVVAASVFVMSSTYLIHFVVEPPGGSGTTIEDQVLASKAETLLDIILGSPGSPLAWDASPTQIDQLKRLGLLDVGSTLRIDADKFDALARGRTATTSSANGGVDYDEAKKALGLTDHEFRLRAYPVKSLTSNDPYGTKGFETYRVAYVGKWSGSDWAAEATAEANALDALDVDFVKALHDATPVKGDLFKDNSNYVREQLLPNIGSTVEQTVLSGGSGTKYDFWRVEPAVYQGLVPGSAPGSLSRALAISSDGATLGYTKNREIRAIVGDINMTGQTSASLSWKEWVDTDRGNLTYDCQDYGFVEVSHDGGANWIRLTDDALQRSQDCGPGAIHGPSMLAREILDITVACPACANKESVLIGFRWFADNDNNIGYGWVVDDVTVKFGLTTVLQAGFEKPAYDMVIIGSGVDNSAFTPNEVKTALSDYVTQHGGRLFITGQTSNVKWLDRLFDASTTTASGALTTPDVAHPLLTLPNKLAHGSYTRGPTWSFTGSDDAGLFTGIVRESAADKQVLTVSRTGAWGAGTSEGAVILSSYLAHAMSAEEARRYFANGIVYGKFRHLYLEFGGEIPAGEPVASATRTATLNKHRTGPVNHTEIMFVLHVWAGRTVAPPLPEIATGVAPGAPLDLVATGGPTSVTLTWKPPASFGTSNPTFYRVYNASNNEIITTVTHTGASSYSYTQNGLLNGRTYYYTVTLLNDRESPHSNNASATPIGLPGAPATPVVTPLVGQLKIDWSPPTDTGGGAIFGYTILVNATPPSAGFVTLVEVGNVTTYTHAVGDPSARSYQVRALNALGWGGDSPASVAVAPADAPVPVGAPTLVATNGVGKIALTWTPPAWLGQTPQTYKIYRADASGGPFALLATVPWDNASFDDVGIPAGVSKWYRISAVTAEAGEGALSEIKTAKAWSAPDAPTGLAVDIVPLTTTRSLSWAAPASELPITHYKIHYRSTPSGAYTEHTTPIVGTSTVHDPGAGTWYYVVRAHSSAGESGNSNEDS